MLNTKIMAIHDSFIKNTRTLRKTAENQKKINYLKNHFLHLGPSLAVVFSISNTTDRKREAEKLKKRHDAVMYSVKMVAYRAGIKAQQEFEFEKLAMQAQIKKYIEQKLILSIGKPRNVMQAPKLKPKAVVEVKKKKRPALRYAYRPRLF